MRSKRIQAFAVPQKTCDPSTEIPCFLKNSVAENGLLNNLMSELSPIAGNDVESSLTSFVTAECVNLPACLQ